MQHIMRRRFCFDLTELLLIASFAAVAGTWYYLRPAPDHVEAVPLVAKYGGEREPRKSGGYEEWIIRDVFENVRNGVFVDIGAYEPKWNSTTWWLETHNGWSGVAVDAVEEYGAAYEAERPRTRFRSFFVSDRSGDTVPFHYVPDLAYVSSADKGFTEKYGKRAEVRQLRTITMNDLLQQEGISRVDFVSIDIELGEPKALAGFDVRRYAPRLVCIEAHAEVRQQILDYFARNGYVIIGKYLRMDPLNLYFRPLE